MVNGDFLVLESDWSDTSTYGLDYHILTVVMANWPKGVGRVTSPGERLVAMANSSSIELSGNHKSPISAIHVLESQEIGDHEIVHFDSGVLFVREDGSRFLFHAPDSIIGGLVLASSPVIISEQVSDASALRRL